MIVGMAYGVIDVAPFICLSFSIEADVTLEIPKYLNKLFFVA